MAIANTVTLNTNFNVDPYYDDFDESKNYHRILYRPGLAVQGRELTQMQTILQNQIDRFGENVYKEGAILTGVEPKIEIVSFVKLRDADSTGAVVTANNFVSTQVRGSTSNALAVVVDTDTGSEAEDPDLKTLYVKYIDTGATSTTGNTVFTANEIITANTGGYTANVASGTSSRGLTQRVAISEGVIFAKDHFIRVPAQSLVLGKYNTYSSYKIGLNIAETIVTNETDSTLLDPASGSYNYAAPGAARLKLNPTLVKYGLTANTGTDFIELTRVENGFLVNNRARTEFSRVNEHLARRSYDTNGNFVVEGLGIRLKEHLKQANNQGRYASGAEGGNSTKLVVEVEPGTAFVKGYDYDVLQTLPVTITKATTTQSIEDVAVTSNYGNYLVVKEVAGVWDVNTHSKVSLRDAAAHAVSNNVFSGTASRTGQEVGTARVRAIDYVSGTKGSSEARYNLYLYDIQTTSNTLSTVKSIHIDNTAGSQANAVADIVLSSGVAALQEVDFNRAIYPLPVTSIKTIRDTTGNLDTNFTFLKEFDVTIAADGTFSVATGAAADRFPFGTGVLSDTNTRTNFNVVLNDEAVSSGTVDTGSMAAMANTVTGLTAADTKFNVGDRIAFAGHSNTFVLTAVTSTTLSTEEIAYGAISSANITKSFKPGHVIDMAGVGGDAADRTINITSTTGADFDIQETLSGTVTATVITELQRVDGQEIAKDYRSNRYVQLTVNQSDGTNNTSGPWNLGLSDGHKLIEVRKKTSNTLFTTLIEGEDVTTNFILDTGQTDNLYKHSKLKLAPGKTASAGDVYLVKMNFFTHDTSQGVGFFSVDSYPIDDANVANTTAITTQEIPLYISPTNGTSYDLRNSIDTRPRIQDTANNVTSLTNISINPAEGSTIIAPAGGLKFMAPNETANFDLDFYLGRRDIITMDAAGAIKITSGTPDINPVYPNEPDGHLPLAQLYVTPYPSLSTYVGQTSKRTDLACKVIPTRIERFTMRDIGRIKDRLDRVEYYTRLSLLENEATNLKFATSTGVDRFKNGVIVDNFNGHNIGNPNDPNYKVSIDRARGELRPPFTLNNIDLDYKSANSSNVIIGPRDTRITVGGTDIFTVGETVTAGAATGKVVYQVGRRVYLESVSGTFAVSATATGGTSSSSGTISAVYTPPAGKLASITYAHRKVINQKYASTTRNAAGLFWKFLGQITLTPNSDYWCETVQAPDLVINQDNTNDNFAVGSASWTTDWGNWETIWSGSTTQDVGDARVFVEARNNNVNNSGVNVVKAGEYQEQITSITEQQVRTGITSTVVPRTTTKKSGSAVINTDVIPFMRSRVINVEGRGFKPNSRLYAFFDGIDVNAYVAPATSAYANTANEGAALTTDSTGDIYCRFRVPNDNSLSFRAGSRRFRLSDSSTNETGTGLVTTSGEATYSSEGKVETVQDTIISTRTYDVVQSMVSETRTLTSSTSDLVKQGQHIVELQYQGKNPDGTHRIGTRNLTDGWDDTAAFAETFEGVEVSPTQLAEFRNQQNLNFPGYDCAEGQDDPIAQTFIMGNFNDLVLASGGYLTKIDLFFATKDATRPVFVELREVAAGGGYITDRIVPFSRVTVEAADINTSSNGGSPTPVYFSTPVFLAKDKEYAIIVRPAANNPNTSLYVSRLGGTDLVTGERINKQPYVGTLFASSNARQWSPIQEEDLKFNLYIANFARNTTATAVFKNEDREFFQTTGSNTFNTIGEQVVGHTTIVGTSALSVNTNFVLVGNTSGANAIVVSQSSNTIVLKDVSLVNKFTAGERVNVVINSVKQEPHTTVHSATTPSGNVIYFDSVNHNGNTVLHLDNASGTFTTGMQLKGQISGSTTTIKSLDKIEVDTMRLNLGSLQFEETSLSSTAKLNTAAATRDTAFRSVNENRNTNFRTPKYVLGKTLEATNISSAKSAEVKVSMSTSNPAIGPVVDLERINLTLVNNTVNNSTANETNADSGDALARYITRSLTLADGQDAEDIRVRLRAYKPSTTGISVYYKILNKDDSDDFKDRSWVLMDQTTVSTVYSSNENENDFKLYDFEVPTANLSGGSNEIQYTNSQGVTFTGYKYLAIKIVLTAQSSGVVPKVDEMITVALQA
jgi:hypothetical protein